MPFRKENAEGGMLGRLQSGVIKRAGGEAQGSWSAHFFGATFKDEPKKR